MKTKKQIIGSLLVASLVVLAPALVLAQSPAGEYGCDARVGLFYMLCKVAELLAAVIPVLIALGVVYFVWGVVTYMIANDEEAKSTGKDRIIFGIIGLAVIVSLWGLVSILEDTFFQGYRGQAPSGNELIDDLLPRRN